MFFLKRVIFDFVIPLWPENHDQAMRILHIETSTKVCSVALSEGGTVVFEKASFEGPSHASLAGLFVEEAMSVAKGTLDAVAVSAGPGSYTGLRLLPCRRLSCSLRKLSGNTETPIVCIVP